MTAEEPIDRVPAGRGGSEVTGTGPDGRLDPYATDGILSRAAPFVFAVVVGLLLLPAQDAPIVPDLLVAAIAAISAVFFVGFVHGRITRIPWWFGRTLPYLWLLAVTVLREATGGTTSGYGALMYLAPFWVALYDTRRQVLLVLTAMFLAQVGHGLWEIGFEHLAPVRRALLSLVVIGFFSIVVQRNVTRLRNAERREASLAHAAAATATELERSNRELASALAREHLVVDRLRELDRLRTRFVAMASHELRTPLASITGFASTLRDRWDETSDGDRQAYISIVDEQGRRLSRMVDDLLVLSRIESGALEPRTEVLPLGEIIESAVNTVDSAGVEIRVDVEADACAWADRDHVEQMIVNLLTNALKYGAGPIVVDARTVENVIEVRVRDHGAGVPPDVASMMFEEFARGRAHVDARIQGTGLGLSIVRGLARAQGGDVRYEPNEPTGATFCLCLPIGSADRSTQDVVG